MKQPYSPPTSLLCLPARDTTDTWAELANLDAALHVIPHRPLGDCAPCLAWDWPAQDAVCHVTHLSVGQASGEDQCAHHAAELVTDLRRLGFPVVVQVPAQEVAA